MSPPLKSPERPTAAQPVRSAWLAVALIGLLAAAGCGTPHTDRSRPSESDPDEPSQQLDGRVTGRLVHVNRAMHYVVMEFPAFRLPALGQVLSVYRQGALIGTVRATGPVRDSTMAADLVSGPVLPGDEVREE